MFDPLVPYQPSYPVYLRESHWKSMGLSEISRVTWQVWNTCSTPWKHGSWGQHGAHLGPTGPRWAPCWPHELCYLGRDRGCESQGCFSMSMSWRHPVAPSTQKPLQWRHNGRNGVSNHHPHDCLLNRLFKRRSKKIPKLRVTGLCAGNSPVTGEFPTQRTSNAENISIWWRNHDREHLPMV